MSLLNNIFSKLQSWVLYSLICLIKLAQYRAMLKLTHQMVIMKYRNLFLIEIELNLTG